MHDIFFLDCFCARIFFGLLPNPPPQISNGPPLTLKDYFAKHTRTHKNHKNTNVELLYIVNCQVQLFLDNMVASSSR